MRLPIFSRMSGVSCRLALPESHDCASVTRVAIELLSVVHQKAIALPAERHLGLCLNGEQSSEEFPRWRSRFNLWQCFGAMRAVARSLGDTR